MHEDNLFDRLIAKHPEPVLKSKQPIPYEEIQKDKVEVADLGSFPLPVGGFCSAHWFDFHPSGIVTVGFYGGGIASARQTRASRSGSRPSSNRSQARS